MPSSIAYHRLIFAPGFRQFFFSQVLTNVSDGVLSAAIIYFALKLGASGFELGVISFGIVLARGLIGPLGGVLGDRMQKKHLLVLMEAGRATIAAVAFLALLTQTATTTNIMALGIAAACLFAIAIPASKSLIPTLIPPENLQVANAAVMAITWPAFFVGSGLFSVFIALDAVELSVLFSALTFVISLVLLCFVPRSEAVPQGANETRPSVWSDMALAYTELRSHRVLFFRVISYAVFTFFWRSAIQIVIPIAILVQSNAPEWLFGVVLFMSGFAELVANLVVGKLRLKEPLVFAFVCEVVLGLGLVFLGVSAFLPVPGAWLVIGAMCIGVSAAFIDIPLITSIQTSIRKENCSKAISYWFAIGAIGGATGSIVIGFLFDHVGFVPLTLGMGAVAGIFGILSVIWAVGQQHRRRSGVSAETQA